MARAKVLELQDISPNAGRCPWRISYRVDDMPVHAFFRPPAEFAHEMGSDEVSLVALPILCDLAAEVRPRSVEVASRHMAPLFRPVFNDAVSALLLEQDARWRRRSLTPLPALRGKPAKRLAQATPVYPRRVVLGFSGGKDSVVSLFSLLGAGYEVLPVLLNEGDRTWQDIRGWLPKLRRLGLRPMVAYLSVGPRKYLRERYGDGYFSSYQLGWLLAVLALCAVKARASTVCLGIESSADFSWTPFRCRRVNHQHQKTTAHLKLLERFYRRALHPELRIASPIADVSDGDVLRALLERVPRPFRYFSSCGAANWRSKHCGECAKCIFIYALLYTSPEGRRLASRLFRRDLLEDVELYRPWLDDRFRLPPGCIGPRSDVWAAFEALSEARHNKPVVEQWKRSQLRRRAFASNGRLIHDGPVKGAASPLGLPVQDATSLVRDWVGANE